MNFKKTTLLATIVAVGMGTASIVNAATATAIWTGVVPSNSADSIVITGVGSSTGELAGMIIAEADGTFVSDVIVMESRKNDAGQGQPAIPGDLVQTNWTVNDFVVRYDNKIRPDADPKLHINDQAVEIGSAPTVASVITAQILQSSPIDAAEIEHADIRASLTMMATEI
ncbi:hypothetical protein NB524_17860 [Vibrio alginolyticus]|uniref:hypothetical protein n=1 Tax=Vibrio alginolyticus TaxID=663 RepID=UPI00215C1967|nr:hypothetical protein [Vibrio alginolyticus]MCR9572199.1 hypothetical protein [Vibrio alginolyticus]